ncbi:hypothetical protein B5M42_004685 [Paenibacillus athensensis]|uniref:DUF5680 domain-containing protein n=1 Tax=Paenibacillus athensensis TaxID=1967502 RepID=A0A4Y8PSI1_9BACL|nr:DUF5680 domain-containing protein [Paenibacillus athensensis]MCD1258135.1 hypothetical protein [Paenibacillus athensensis]
MPMDHREGLLGFLIEAKRATYATEGAVTAVEPALRGSRQLEYRSGSYTYRDIYFGSAFFAGQELVELEGRPLWSMTYAGGLLPDAPAAAEVYGFLRRALREVGPGCVYRGPERVEQGVYTYVNEADGPLDFFHGKEWIEISGRRIYELRYNGGVIVP